LLKENVVNNRRAVRLGAGFACLGLGAGYGIATGVAAYWNVELPVWYYVAGPLVMSLIAFAAAAVSHD
jgi:hypothetical protein